MLEIKKASSIHLEPLLALFEQYRKFYEMPPEKEKSRKFIRQRLIQKDSIIFLAFKNQQAVGFTQIYTTFSSVAMQPLWLLNDLFVKKSERRKSIAKKLINTIEIEARKAKVFSVKLATTTDNNYAKNLYESLDYLIMKNFTHYSKQI